MDGCELAYKIYHTHLTKQDMDLEAAYADGMFRKEQLIHNAAYIGYCRNATVAVWNADTNLFIYWRTKFKDRFEETIPHPEDDDGYDLFVPTRMIMEEV